MTKTYQPPFTITSAIINLIADISESLGRLSILEDDKNLRLRRINRIRTIQGSLAIEGNTLLGQLPVKSIAHQHQSDYYQAIRKSTEKTNSALFIEFMLSTILDMIKINPAPHDTPQVNKLLLVLHAQSQPMNRDELQVILKLKDRKSFRERYLKPALDKGLIKMTLPDKPNSRLQKYTLTAQGQLIAKS